ncbi:MAG: hypothetical protein ACM336_05250 [Acidobacteriota bacterium]
MVLLAAEALGVLMRWIHISSAALLVGGVACARVVAAPAERYRPVVYGAVAGIVASGLYGLLTRTGHTRYYHIWFGVKMLLALHVFAGAALAFRPAANAAEEAKRARRLTGVTISGLAVILVAAYLRSIY